MPLIECPKEGCDWSTPIAYTDHPSGSYNHAFRLGRQRYRDHFEKEHYGENDRRDQGDPSSCGIQSSTSSTSEEASGTEAKE